MSNFTFDTDDDDVIVNVANGRCPTVNDLYAKIKQLEGDNFQLRVRIYMNEQSQEGKNPNKFDPTSKNQLAEEFRLMRKERDELRQKCHDLQSEQSDLETKMKNLQLPNINTDANETLIAEFNQKIANMTKALVELGTKFTVLEDEHKRLTDEHLTNVKKLSQKEDECKALADELALQKARNGELCVKLKKLDEDVQKLNKDNEINMAHRVGEMQLKDRQLQVQSQQMGNLLADNQVLVERLRFAEDAIKLLHQEHSKLVVELKTLRSGFSSHVLNIATSANEIQGAHGDGKCENSRQDTSPDLGIESGQDIASIDGNVYAENAMLKKCKRQLEWQLQQARQELDRTNKRLSTTAKHKEQVEKAVCRQLHKQHSILKEAKLSMEQKQSQQVLTNLLPPSV